MSSPVKKSSTTEKNIKLIMPGGGGHHKAKRKIDNFGIFPPDKLLKFLFKIIKNREDNQNNVFFVILNLSDFCSNAVGLISSLIAPDASFVKFRHSETGTTQKTKTLSFQEPTIMQNVKSKIVEYFFLISS